MSKVGTMSIGVRTGIIKEGDDLVDITVNSVLSALDELNMSVEDKDIIAVTEAVVGISTGNYCTIDDIAKDLKSKVKTRHLGIVYPILSRNRFAVLLSAFARAMDKITFVLSYPSDEVGNDILDKDRLKNLNIPLNNYVMSEKEYSEKFGDFKHVFTGVNMVDFYRDLCKKENCDVEFVFSNNPEVILDYTKEVLCADIHTRNITKELIKKNGGVTVLGLDDLLTNKTVEVMIYGDGAFKDPVGKIWELADPVVSPAYTSGLEGSPNEIKLKYLSDNKFAGLSGEELNNKIKEEIKEKSNNLKGTMASQGTTPRRYTDLIGSLCDLTSGSGDKGTPVVFIKNYFKNYAD